MSSSFVLFNKIEIWTNSSGNVNTIKKGRPHLGNIRTRCFFSRIIHVKISWRLDVTNKYQNQRRLLWSWHFSWDILYIQITVEHDYLLNYCLPEYLLKILLYMNFLFRNIYECVKGAARAMSVAARERVKQYTIQYRVKPCTCIQYRVRQYIMLYRVKPCTILHRVKQYTIQYRVK